MKIISENDTKSIQHVCEVLQTSDVILYPTDTVYGLGADPDSREAVEKIFQIKKRPAEKAPLLLARDAEIVRKYAEIPKEAEKYVNDWPAPLTLVLPRRRNAFPSFFPEQTTLAFRVPDHGFCQELLKAFGKPIISTSANLSGEETQTDLDSVLRQISNENIALAVESQTELTSTASTIIAADHRGARVLRKGAYEIDA